MTEATESTDASSTTGTDAGGTTGEDSESGMSSGVGEGGCADGTQGCPCYGNMTCNDGLACAGEVCVPMQAAVCGDGMLGGTEECDAGPANGDTATCKSNCETQKCGDGFIGPGEACDDGNVVEDDMCTSACVPAACGDAVVQTNEACDDGNVDTTDACIACQAAVCGDTFVQAGVEACDDGNAVDGDGCSAACVKEMPNCSGNFTTEWCPQAGPMEQFTRCESVSNGGTTCNNPFIKYGTTENAVPASHNGNDLVTWCMQLGFATFSGEVSYGDRPCDAPQGKVFGCIGYDDPAVWHWCDWEDGHWYSDVLNSNSCNDGQEITSITCQ